MMYDKALMINNNLIFDFDEEPFYKKYSEMNFTRYQTKLREIDEERTSVLSVSGAMGAQGGVSEEEALRRALELSLRDQQGPGGAAPGGAASGGGKKKKRKISFKKRKNKRNKTEKK